ncbi:MAG: DUF4012 domain-containing protein [Patescibacteria group bacterium]
MRQKNLNLKKIKIKQTDKPSCFVIDLKENLEQEEKSKSKLKEKFNKANKIKHFYFSLVLIGKNLKISLEKKVINIFQQAKKAVNIYFTLLYFNNKPWGVWERREINQLAFVELVGFIFKIIKALFIFAYKICFYIGWTTLFLIRFAYLVLAILLKLIIKPIRLLTTFIGKISFYSVVESGKMNYAVWMIIIRSWQLIKQKICSKALIINKIIEQKKFLVRQNMKSRVNIFKINKINFSERLTIKNFLPKPNIGYLKPVLIFAGILLIIILPVKAFTYYKVIDNIRDKVLGDSEQAFSQLLSAGKSAVDLDFNQARKNFSQAGDDFLSAQTKLSEINNLLLSLTAIAPDKNLRLASISRQILQSGQLSADLGKNLSLAITPPTPLVRGETQTLLSGGELKLSCKGGKVMEVLDNFRLYGGLAVDQAIKLNKLLETININDLPDQYSEQFILLKKKTAMLANGLSSAVSLADKIGSFLGATVDKRYLLVFQNNTELRASGGFIGSFALIDFSNGKLKNIEAPMGGSYDVEAGMLDKIIAPQPLQLIAPQWHFWDANWWADWPTSANKLMLFYEKSDGPTVDGVISITPTVIEELLKIIGPIDLTEQYGIVFDADNFWIKTQELAEQKADKTNQPKKIIGDLMNKIIAELPNRITKDNLIPLLKVADQLFSSKQILFYFTDPELQNKIIDLGWDGGFKETNKDYLAVVNTNIAGGKSDRKIEETINHQAEIMPDGTIIDTVKITRIHTGVKREPFSGVRNVNWMRIYTPQGSQLISAQGFDVVDEIYFKKPDSSWQTDSDIFKTESNTEVDETSGTKIYQELNKTVFANWSQVDPGQSITITLKYKLPFKIMDSSSKLRGGNAKKGTDKIISQTMDLINPDQKQLYPYSLLIQKQPGAKADQITANLIVNNFSPVWKYPKGLSVNQTGWHISDNLDSDKFWAVVLEEVKS